MILVLFAHLQLCGLVPKGHRPVPVLVPGVGSPALDLGQDPLGTTQAAVKFFLKKLLSFSQQPIGAYLKGIL